MQSAHEIVKDMVCRWKANPALLIPFYKGDCPGITDDEALKLAQLFVATFDSTANTEQERKRDSRFLLYRAAMKEAQRKYPGGEA